MQHHHINYAEYPAFDLEATKTFFKQVFAWRFTDYGPDYTTAELSPMAVGFFRSEKRCRQQQGGALLVFYSLDLVATQNQIEFNGGKMSKDVFTFPGGRRFHFIEPSGNEFAVWSDK